LTDHYKGELFQFSYREGSRFFIKHLTDNLDRQSYGTGPAITRQPKPIPIEDDTGEEYPNSEVEQEVKEAQNHSTDNTINSISEKSKPINVRMREQPAQDDDNDTPFLKFL
jgi:hypothetical protein